MKRALEELPVPPLAPWLSAAVAVTRPVRTRRPWRAVALVAGLGLAALAGLLLLRVGVRGDLGALPRPPLLLSLAPWLLAFLAQLWAAPVPPRGSVLPSGRRAARASLFFGAVAAPLGLAAGRAWPGLDASVAPGAFWPSTLGCLALGGLFCLTPLVTGLGLLARLTPRGPWSAGVAVSGAAGVLAGVGLTLHCPRADALHVAVAHGVPVELPMVVAASLAVLAYLAHRRDDDERRAP